VFHHLFAVRLALPTAYVARRESQTENMTPMRTHIRWTAVAFLAGPALLSGVCLARDVTDAERASVRQAARRYIASDDRILKLTASWGEDNGSPWLEARVTTRPFDVGQGLCVAEVYIFHKKEDEDTFRLMNDGVPISQYWEQKTPCDLIDAEVVNYFGRIPNTVWVSQAIATTHVAQIIRGSKEIISLARPDVWCDEPIMPRIMRPGIHFRLASIEIDRKNAPGAGIRYSAEYTREGSRDLDGVVVYFTLYPDYFEVHGACFWIS
jgi:hypothetical protein